MQDDFGRDEEFERLNCQVCGHSFAPDDLVDIQGSRMCAGCKRETVGRMESGHAPPDGTGGVPAPWERRRELGGFTAFFLTVKEVIVDPGGFFERLDKRNPSRDCLLFAVILVSAVGAVGWAFQTALVALMTAVGVSMGADGGMGMFLGMQGTTGCILVVFMPLIAIVHLYSTAGMTHLFLMATKNARAPFFQTVRGTAYAIAPQVLGIIPIIGGAGALYAIVVQIFMVMKVHRTSGGVASLAVLWWMVFGCCLGFVAFGALFTAALSAGAR